MHEKSFFPHPCGDSFLGLTEGSEGKTLIVSGVPSVITLFLCVCLSESPLLH